MLLFTTYSNEEARAKHQALVTELYPTAQKPKLDNAKNVKLHIGVEEDGKVLAFASLFQNTSYQDYLLIGNYECTKDSKVAAHLFANIEVIAAEENCSFLLGPIAGDTWHTYRFSALDAPRFFMETIHQDYYLQQWRDYGFGDFGVYQTNQEAIDSDRELPDFDHYFESRGIHYRHFNMQDSENELRVLYTFCSELFKSNFFFSPISQADFVAMYTPLLPLLDPSLIYFALDKQEVVGLLFAVENHLCPSEVIVKTIARHPAEKYRGLANMMSALFYSDIKNGKYTTMLHAYFHISNRSSMVSQNYGGEMYQKHSLLRKEVG